MPTTNCEPEPPRCPPQRAHTHSSHSSLPNSSKLGMIQPDDHGYRRILTQNSHKTQRWPPPRGASTPTSTQTDCSSGSDMAARATRHSSCFLSEGAGPARPIAALKSASASRTPHPSSFSTWFAELNSSSLSGSGCGSGGFDFPMDSGAQGCHTGVTGLAGTRGAPNALRLAQRARRFYVLAVYVEDAKLHQGSSLQPIDKHRSKIIAWYKGAAVTLRAGRISLPAR